MTEKKYRPAMPNSYVLNWLSSSPAHFSAKTRGDYDMDKRVDRVIAALLKDTEPKILSFSPRK